MANSAVPGVDLAAVEAHLAQVRGVVPALQGGRQLGVGQHQGKIQSANGASDSIPAVIVACMRCGFLMPLALDLVTPADTERAA